MSRIRTIIGMLWSFNAAAVAVFLSLVGLVMGANPWRQTPPKNPVGQRELTILGWSDQHIRRDGMGDHLFPAIEAMNTMAGRAYPAGIGGQIQQPAFVIGCGDMTDWPTLAARSAWIDIAAHRLPAPAFDVLGNHDQGAWPYDHAMSDWISARHGSLSYSFDCGGVHFAFVFSAYDRRQHITQEALSFIRHNLAQTPPGRPVVLAMHYGLNTIGNKDELIDAMGEANVVLVLGGHAHIPAYKEYRGRRFVQLPSPAATTEIAVIRISPERLVVLAYDYRLNLWSQSLHVDSALTVANPGRFR